MREQELTTWTDEQLQEQLDLWASQIEQGRIPEMSLTGDYPYPSRTITEQTLYKLKFEEQTIKLTIEQARYVNEWMNVYRFQVQLNRLETVRKEISSQNQQQENKS